MRWRGGLMAEQHAPITWFDVAVYAPIGAAARLCELAPRLAQDGRERIEHRIQLARMIGRIAVRQGRRELIRRLDEIAEQRRLEAEGVAPAPEPAPQRSSDHVVATSPPSSGTTATAERSDDAVSSPGIVPLAGELAISDYDSLAASQVVARLPGLSADDLDAVGAYEAAHRGRRTILGKVQQLQAQ